MRRIGCWIAFVGSLAAMLGTGQARASASAPAGPSFKEPKQLVWKEGVKNAYPRWSKDGSRILYQSNRTGKWQIHVMNQDARPSISRDGKKVVFNRESGETIGIYVVDLK